MGYFSRWYPLPKILYGNLLFISSNLYIAPCFRRFIRIVHQIP